MRQEFFILFCTYSVVVMLLGGFTGTADALPFINNIKVTAHNTDGISVNRYGIRLAKITVEGELDNSYDYVLGSVLIILNDNGNGVIDPGENIIKITQGSLLDGDHELAVTAGTHLVSNGVDDMIEANSYGEFLFSFTLPADVVGTSDSTVTMTFGNEENDLAPAIYDPTILAQPAGDRDNQFAIQVVKDENVTDWNLDDRVYTNGDTIQLELEYESLSLAEGGQPLAENKEIELLTILPDFSNVDRAFALGNSTINVPPFGLSNDTTSSPATREYGRYDLGEWNPGNKNFNSLDLYDLVLDVDRAKREGRLIIDADGGDIRMTYNISQYNTNGPGYKRVFVHAVDFPSVLDIENDAEIIFDIAGLDFPDDLNLGMWQTSDPFIGDDDDDNNDINLQHPDVIHVPADYPTIQEAIDVVYDGNTVLVADGVYTGTGNVNLDLGGRPMTVKSENGAGNCIIDCEEVDGTCGFYFHSGEGLDSVVDGFTIRKARSSSGGGIICLSNSSPTIVNNVIRGCWAQYGGGIYCNSSSPTIASNTIKENVGTFWGGGIYCEGNSSPTVVSNIIKQNGGADGGGGILCDSTASPVIEGNFITENASSELGGGVICLGSGSFTVTNNTVTANSTVVYAFWGSGGVVCIGSGSFTISNNTITGNSVSAEQAPGAHGGGIYCEGSGSYTITSNLITGNSVSAILYDAWGGGICCEGDASFNIANNIIIGNSVDGDMAAYGGGIYCEGNASLTIANNTIAGNSVRFSEEICPNCGGGGILCTDNTFLTITNTILWENTPQEIYFTAEGAPNTVNISYSDVRGGQAAIATNDNGTVNWGDGNIDKDPLFVDAANDDYHLSDFSPCIGAGTVTADMPQEDIEENSRPSPPGSDPDMGAYESNLGEPLDVIVLDLTIPAVASVFEGDYSPNPFQANLAVHRSTGAAMSGVTVQISLPGGLALYSGQNSSVDIGDIPAGGVGQATWDVCITGDVVDDTLTVSASAASTSPDLDATINRTIQVPPIVGTISTVDGNGNVQNTFYLYQTVYFTGTDFARLSPCMPNNRYGVYVVPSSISTGADLTSWDVSGGANILSTNADGDFSMTPIWYEAGSAGSFKIVVDGNRNGLYDNNPGKDATALFTVTVPPHPTVFAANASQQMTNRIDQGSQLRAIGSNFDPDTTVDIYVVDNQYVWQQGDLLVDTSGGYETIVTNASGNIPSGTILWFSADVGAFDIVVDENRNGQYDDGEAVDDPHIVGLTVTEALPPGHREYELACDYDYWHLRYRNQFEVDENVYCTVNPSSHPEVVYISVDVYVVDSQSSWATGNILTDVSGGYETHRVQPGCWNINFVLIAPAGSLQIGGVYDVVVDVNQNGAYDLGIDMIDSVAAAGFEVTAVPPIPPPNIRITAPSTPPGGVD